MFPQINQHSLPAHSTSFQFQVTTAMSTVLLHRTRPFFLFIAHSSEHYRIVFNASDWSKVM